MVNSGIINRIKYLNANQKLSFIVGAGFSKNMSQKFLSWKELLSPMIKEMYDCKDETDIKNKIDEIGYIGIASEYVRRKGYHEAIDLYIEEHTPYIKEGGDKKAKYEVWLGEKPIDVADTVCHDLLMNQNARHIFTFNYDNCLDILGKTHVSSKLMREIWSAKENVKQLELQKEEYEQSWQSYDKGHTAVQSADTYRGLSKENIEIINDKIISEKGRISQLNRTRKLHYQLITSSQMLSMTDNGRNIYKLHGTHRLADKCEFGFDNDRRCHYIITREDYETYADKHEPLVNFMKISLLKGAFCILGFSCDDPNFLSWIDWVKDVIDKHESIRKELSLKESARFYYINSGKDDLDAHKKLLLKNHFIECVNLYDLYPETICEGDNIHKVQLAKFLLDISSSISIVPKIEESWAKIYNVINRTHLPESVSDFSEVEKEIDFIHTYAYVNGIPNQHNYTHHNRIYTLQQLSYKFNKTYPEFSELELKLACCALNEEKLIPQLYFEQNILDNLGKATHQTQPDNYNYKRILNKGKAMLNAPADNVSHESDYYLTIWRKLFNLDFNGAQKALSQWNPGGERPIDSLRKHQMQSLYDDTEEANLNYLCRQEIYDNLQDYVNALLILPRTNARFTSNWKRKPKYEVQTQEELTRIKEIYPYLQSFKDIIDSLVDSIQKPDKPQPFGNTVQSYVFHMSNSKFLDAFKVLSIAFELCLVFNNFFDENKWFSVFKQIYEIFPYPCLFYTLQCSNKDVIKKASQMMLYSDDLKENIPDLVLNMFKALNQQSCPKRFKESILISLPVLLCGVNPEIWNRDFIHYYNRLSPLKNSMRRFDDLNYNLESFYTLISDGLRLSTDKRFKIKVIVDVLLQKKKINNWGNHLLIKAKEKLTDSDIIESEQYDKLNRCLKWLCNNFETGAHIYVILNMSSFIEANHLTKTLENVPLSLIEKDCTLISFIPKYLPADSEMKKQIKEMILKSKFLWENGIEGDNVSVRFPFLQIAELTKYLNLSQEDLKVIWDKMIHSLKQVKAVCEKDLKISSHKFFSCHFGDILDEMLQFIRNNDITLISPEELERIKNEIYELRLSLSKDNGNNTLEDLLVNDNTSDAINMLVNIDGNILFDKYNSELILIANRLIMRYSSSLNECMRFFAWVLEKWETFVPQDIYKLLLNAILSAYKPYFNGEKSWDLENGKKDVFEDALCNLHTIFKKWGGTNEFWNNYKRRFYN